VLPLHSSFYHSFCWVYNVGLLVGIFHFLSLCTSLIKCCLLCFVSLIFQSSNIGVFTSKSTHHDRWLQWLPEYCLQFHRRFDNCLTWAFISSLCCLWPQMTYCNDTDSGLDRGWEVTQAPWWGEYCIHGELWTWTGVDM
jgi:hypothetical protein